MEPANIAAAWLVLDHVPPGILFEQWEVFFIVLPIVAGIAGAVFMYRKNKPWWIGLVIGPVLVLVIDVLWGLSLE